MSRWLDAEASNRLNRGWRRLRNVLVLVGVVSVVAACYSDDSPTVTYHAENQSSSLYFVDMTGATSGRFIYLPPHSASLVFYTRDEGRVQATVYLQDCRQAGTAELDPEHTNLRIGDSGSVSTTTEAATASAAAPTPLDGIANNPGGDFCASPGWWIGARNDSGETLYVETPYRSFLMPPHSRGMIYRNASRPFPPDVFAVVHDANCTLVARQELAASRQILVIAADGAVSAQPAATFWAPTPSVSELYVRGAESRACAGVSGSSNSPGPT